MLRKLLMLAVICAATTGCTASQALFSVFGDSYSGGGHDRVDRRSHYDSEVERWKQ